MGNRSGQVRLVLRHSRMETRLVILIALVLSMAALTALALAQWEAAADLEASTARAAALEQENARLRQQTEELGSEESVRRIAAEKLGLVDPGTVFFSNGNSNEIGGK